MSKILFDLDDPADQRVIEDLFRGVAYTFSLYRCLRKAPPVLRKVREGEVLTYRECATLVTLIGGLAHIIAGYTREAWNAGGRIETWRKRVTSRAEAERKGTKVQEFKVRARNQG